MKKIVLIIIIGILICYSFNVQSYSYIQKGNNDIIDNHVNLIFSNENLLNLRTLYVDDDGGVDYSRIQDAINNASDGDNIYVYSGIYFENIQINKQLIIEGENCYNTVIDGGGIDSVVTVNSENVVISGFTITNCNNSSDYAGIIINSNNVKIDDNIISFNKGSGIIGRELSDVLIQNNVISHNYYDGIYLESIEHSEISHNTIENHSYWYYLYGGIIPRSHGFVLYNSNDIMVSDNVFRDALNIDFVISGSLNIKVRNNDFSSKSGVLIEGSLSHWTSHSFFNNRVDNKPIYYYKNDLIGKTVPLDAGEVILANCRNFKIHNLTIYDGDVGVSIGYCSNIEIMDNVIENTAEGIYIKYSDNIFISGNRIYNVWGVPFLYSCNNSFVNNVIDCNFRYGLGLWYGSNNNNIYNNTIVSNNEDGIISYESNDNHIIFNTINGNNQSGLELIDSDFNTISGNTFSSNNNDGVKLSFSSNNNVIHHNNFLNNSLHNAYGGSGNSWDFGMYGGNFWSDYIGVDTDGDGFGDEPYEVSSNVKDNYPYIEPIIYKQPLKPDKPIGPSTGKISENNSYTFHGIDPLNCDLYYLIDWGDNSDKVWYGPFKSDESIDISHSWIRSNDYSILVKSKNIIGIESDWSDSLVVSMPKNKMIFSSSFNFIYNHLHLFLILRMFLNISFNIFERII